MPRHLPSRPNLKHLKQQAKQLVKACRNGDSEAAECMRTHLPRLAKVPDSGVIGVIPTLQEAQFVIAREYGFADWPQLSAFVTEITLRDVLSQSEIDALTGSGPNPPDSWIASAEIGRLKQLHLDLSNRLKNTLAEFMNTPAEVSLSGIGWDGYDRFIRSHLLKDQASSYRFRLFPSVEQAILSVALNGQVQQLKLAKSVLEDLQHSWVASARLRCTDIVFCSYSSLLQVAATPDDVVVAQFSVESANLSAWISLCYPRSTVEFILAQLQ